MDGDNGTSENKAQGRYQELGEEILPAETGSIEKFINFASEHARMRGFTDNRINEIREVLTEALGNIIKFTFDDSNGEIKVSCNVDKFGKFVLAIVDSGNPLTCFSRTTPSSALSILTPRDHG